MPDSELAKRESREIPKEKVDMVSPCAAVYLSTFSKPPFCDIWAIDGERVPGLLLSANANTPFIQTLMLDPNVRYNQGVGYEGDEVIVPTAAITNHLDNLFRDPYTEQLVTKQGDSPAWISELEMAQLSDLLKKLTESDQEVVTISIPYSLVKIIEAYRATVQDPDSLVLLSYIQPEVTDDITMVRVEPDTNLPENMIPVAITRTKTFNRPERQGPTAGFQLLDDLIPEIDYYLQGEDLERVKKAIEPQAHTSFLAEIAVSPESASGNATLASLQAVLSGMGERLPEQVIYLTLEGTPVSRKRFKDKPSALATAINYGIRDYEQGRYQEERLTFETEKQGTVIIGILRRVEEIT